MRAINLIILALLAALASSCKGKEIGRCGLTEAEKQLIPYELKQVVSFIDGEGQTIELTVISNETKWNKEKEDGFGDDYVSFEIKSVILRSEPNNLEIKLENIYPEVCNSKYYTLYIRIRINDGWGFTLKSNSEGIFQHTAYSSLEINGKVYHDVVELKVDANYPYRQLYYSKTYGILQINRDGENFLTLNHSNR